MLFLLKKLLLSAKDLKKLEKFLDLLESLFMERNFHMPRVTLSFALPKLDLKMLS
jgi:hypothetical protein